MTRGPTRWHYVGCALLSAVIGAGIAGFPQRSPDPPRQAPVREAVRVQPQLVSSADSGYGFTLLLPERLPRSAQPPPRASCEEVYRWSRQHGGEDVGLRRVLLRGGSRR